MTKPLTIGVDVRDLQLAKTGTKTYLEELCKEFKKLNSTNIRFCFLDAIIPVYTGNNRLWKLTEHLRFQLWKQVMLPLKAYYNNCDVVFCTDNVVPIIHLGYQTIPVFHDAFFFENPEHYGKLWLWLYKKTAIPAAKRSAFIITPSAYAKKQLISYLAIDIDKLIVIHEGPKALNNEPHTDTDSIFERFAIDKGNYLLHVGSMFKRKNIPALINAFGEIKKTGYPNLKLVLAGSTAAGNSESDHKAIMAAVKANNLDGSVVFTHYLTDADLARLYKNALAYVFPSVNEGFGIPVLEAFQYGLPVLVANNTALPEVGDDAVLQFDPFDEDDIALKIKLILDEPALRLKMISKGRNRLKEFSWHFTALQLIQAFRKCV